MPSLIAEERPDAGPDMGREPLESRGRDGSSCD